MNDKDHTLKASSKTHRTHLVISALFTLPPIRGQFLDAGSKILIVILILIVISLPHLPHPC